MDTQGEIRIARQGVGVRPSEGTARCPVLEAAHPEIVLNSSADKFEEVRLDYCHVFVLTTLSLDRMETSRAEVSL